MCEFTFHNLQFFKSEYFLKSTCLKCNRGCDGVLICVHVYSVSLRE